MHVPDVHATAALSLHQQGLFLKRNCLHRHAHKCIMMVLHHCLGTAHAVLDQQSC